MIFNPPIPPATPRTISVRVSLVAVQRTCVVLLPSAAVINSSYASHAVIVAQLLAESHDGVDHVTDAVELMIVCVTVQYQPSGQVEVFVGVDVAQTIEGR